MNLNRLAVLIALVLVVAAVSAGIASQTTSSLVLASVMMLTGVLAYKFVHGSVAANTGATISNFPQFLSFVIRNVFRFGIGAVVIAWMAISTLWFFGA
jgi:hypothetical protein